MSSQNLKTNDEDERNILVAVYGSLKKGFGNHVLLEDAEFLGEDWIPGWDMYSLGGFPAITPSHRLRCLDKNDTKIEVYLVNEKEFISLDRLEGYPSFYNRTKVHTHYGEAWIYFMSEPPKYGELIKEGVW